MEDIEFDITESAAKRIAFLMTKQQKNNTKLRISVEGGGCSGFQYKYDLSAFEPEECDKIFKKNDAIVIIDDVSLGFLNGAKLDYIENLGGEYFEIKNPNAASGCGCGNSFAV